MSKTIKTLCCSVCKQDNISWRVWADELNNITGSPEDKEIWCDDCENTAKARDLYQTENIVPIAWVQAMIEILGYIFGIGFLIWLTAAIILYAVANHWMDR